MELVEAKTMAKMKKIDLKGLIPNVRVKVGHNREVEKVDGGSAFYGYLHGHHIFSCNETGVISLTTRGWHTVTTRQALNDFLGYFGYPHRVSLAGGKISVYVYGHLWVEGDSAVVFNG